MSPASGEPRTAISRALVFREAGDSLRVYIRRFPDKLITMALSVVLVILLVLNGFSLSSIGRMLAPSSYIVLVTVGLCIVLSVGELDLSVFGIISLSSIATLWIAGFVDSSNLLLAAAITILVMPCLCTGLSMVNSLLVIELRRPSLLVTIATYSTFYGLALVAFLRLPWEASRSDEGISPFASSTVLREFFLSSRLGIPVQALVAVLALACLWIFLNFTKLGLMMKAVGQNELSAQYSGINVRRVKHYAFLLAGIMYGVAATIRVSKFPTSRPSELLEDPVIAIMCATFSGAELRGGRLPTFFVLVGVIGFLCLRQLVISWKIAEAAEANIASFGVVLLVYILGRYRKEGRAT